MKAFDKLDHGIFLHKLKDMGITGKRDIWFFQFLTNRTHYVRIPGAIPKTVLSVLPQGKVFGPLLFLIMISDINQGTTSSKLISFADDIGLYSNIALADFQKLYYISYSSSLFYNSYNVYANANMEIIEIPHLMSWMLVYLCLVTVPLSSTFDLILFSKIHYDIR